MARIRSVKPSLRTSRVVAQWPREVRYAWVLLWGYLDDEGRGLDIPKAIAGDCFPLDDDVTAKVMERWLDMMATSSTDGVKPPPLCRYQVAGARYIHAVNWDDNQKPNRPRPSVLPPCELHDMSSDAFTASFSESRSDTGTEAARAGGGEKGRRGSGGAVHASRSEPPGASGAPPPPRTCRKHPDGTDAPCRACQAARELREQWDADQARKRLEDAATEAARRAEIANAPRCPTCGNSELSTYHQRMCAPSEVEDTTDAA